MKQVKNPQDNSLRILIVEDDFYCRRLLQRMLSPYGDCEVAANGEEAVEAYEKSLADEFSYDLICLDILMPVLDGHKALQRIRKIEEINHIYGSDCVKVILTSATENRRVLLDAFKTGCEGYVPKPIDKNLLITKLGELGLLS